MSTFPESVSYTHLLGSIFDTLMNVGVIALIVLFQDEIRRFLLTLGSHRHRCV